MPGDATQDHWGRCYRFVFPRFGGSSSFSSSSSSRSKKSHEQRKKNGITKQTVELLMDQKLKGWDGGGCVWCMESNMC